MNKQVLIVENKPTQVLIVSESLQSEGIEVKTVCDAQAALDFLQDNLPDVVVSDIEMANVDGFQLCQRMRENERTKFVPVILLTALSEIDEMLHAIEDGASYFLVKPANPKLLIGYINDILNKKKQPENIQPLNFSFQGKNLSLSTDPEKMVSLLLSTYEIAMQRSSAFEEIRKKLQEQTIEFNLFKKEKSTFFGIASHNLRNPISVILGYSEIMFKELQDKIDQKYLKMIEKIELSSRSMLNIITEFIDAAQTESGKLSLDYSMVLPKHLIDKSVQLNEPLAKKETDSSSNPHRKKPA